jgi:hypothetical protein
MRVHVYESRRYHEPCRVNREFARATDPSESHDPFSSDREIADGPGSARAIQQRAASNKNVVLLLGRRTCTTSEHQSGEYRYCQPDLSCCHRGLHLSVWSVGQQSNKGRRAARWFHRSTSSTIAVDDAGVLLRIRGTFSSDHDGNRIVPPLNLTSSTSGRRAILGSPNIWYRSAGTGSYIQKTQGQATWRNVSICLSHWLIRFQLATV